MGFFLGNVPCLVAGECWGGERISELRRVEASGLRIVEASERRSVGALERRNGGPARRRLRRGHGVERPSERTKRELGEGASLCERGMDFGLEN